MVAGFANEHSCAVAVSKIWCWVTGEREREREEELLFSAWGVACGRRTAAKTLGKEFKVWEFSEVSRTLSFGGCSSRWVVGGVCL